MTDNLNEICIGCRKLIDDLHNQEQFIDDPEGLEEELNIWHTTCHGGRGRLE